MTDPILHHYDASPFSQKAQKLLGIKQLAWHSVEMPMTAPKPDLEAITGGYRGTPVLQLGSDVFIDTVAIADALDHFFPHGTALTDETKLLSDAMGLWADSLFAPVLGSAVALYAADWDEHFYNDRAAVFPHLDFAALPAAQELMADRITQLARQLNAQLVDGRNYMSGDACGLVDVHCWGVLWFVRNGLPHIANELLGLDALIDWADRIDNLGSGERLVSDYDAARAALLQPPADLAGFPGAKERSSGLDGWWDTPVQISAVGADRGGVAGILVGQGDRFTTLRVDGADLPMRHVHFPRQGYDIHRV